MNEENNYKIITKNREAYFDYEVHETYEVGVKLAGWEVKSLRIYGASLRNSFCIIKNNEIFWTQANLKNPIIHMENYNGSNTRKLLLRINQIKRIKGVLTEKHYAIIPLNGYFKYGRYFKLTIGICTKNKKFDKREKIKKRDLERDRARDCW